MRSELEAKFFGLTMLAAFFGMAIGAFASLWLGGATSTISALVAIASIVAWMAAAVAPMIYESILLVGLTLNRAAVVKLFFGLWSSIAAVACYAMVHKPSDAPVQTIVISPTTFLLFGTAIIAAFGMLGAIEGRVYYQMLLERGRIEPEDRSSVTVRMGSAESLSGGVLDAREGLSPSSRPRLKLLYEEPEQL